MERFDSSISALVPNKITFDAGSYGTRSVGSYWRSDAMKLYIIFEMEENIFLQNFG